MEGALLYRERAEKSARGGDRHAYATKERRTSSASNAARTQQRLRGNPQARGACECAT